MRKIIVLEKIIALQNIVDNLIKTCNYFSPFGIISWKATW